MAPDSGAPAGKGGRRQNSAGGSSRNRIERPEINDRIEYRCPSCGKAANATFKTGDDGHAQWFIGCWTFGCEGRELHFLALELGLDAAADKDEIAQELARRSPPRHRTADAPPLPHLDEVDDWHLSLRLREGRRARRYLVRRGISRRVMREHRIGWDGARLVFPMDGPTGQLAAIKTRVPAQGARMMKPKGSGAWTWPLYPQPQAEPTRLFLVEGEIDALRLLSLGIPAASVTGGVDTWRDEWADELRGHHVVVAFDVEFERAAADRAARLRDAGVNARVFDLRRLGLTERNEDLSDYLRRGGDPETLHRVLAARVVRRKRSGR